MQHNLASSDESMLAGTSIVLSLIDSIIQMHKTPCYNTSMLCFMMVVAKHEKINNTQLQLICSYSWKEME